MDNIERIIRRLDTQKGWDAMREKFFAEWSDGYWTVWDHQSRFTRANGYVSAEQVNQWFAAHAMRQVEERWLEYKNEKEEIA